MITENIAGTEWATVKNVIGSIAEALNFLHDAGMIHGDLKPNNVVRIDNRYKLIDLDASTIIMGVLGSKYSLAYSPPELLYLDPASNEIRVREPPQVSDQSNNANFELLFAQPAYDAWALGMLVSLTRSPLNFSSLPST